MRFDVRYSQLLGQAFNAGWDNLGGGPHVLGHPEQDFGIKDIHKTACIAWHVRVQMFEYLLPERGVLLDESATVPRHELEVDEDRIRFVLRQSEAVD